MLGKIGGAGDQFLADKSDRYRQQAAVCQLSDPHRDVDTLFHNTDIAIDKHHSDIELFMLLHHGSDHRQYVQPSEHDRCRDIKLSTGFGSGAGDLSLGILYIGQYPACAGQKRRAIIGQ